MFGLTSGGHLQCKDLTNWQGVYLYNHSTDVHLCSLSPYTEDDLQRSGWNVWSGQEINTFRHEEIGRPLPYGPDSNFNIYDTGREILRNRLLNTVHTCLIQWTSPCCASSGRVLMSSMNVCLLGHWTAQPSSNNSSSCMSSRPAFVSSSRPSRTQSGNATTTWHNSSCKCCHKCLIVNTKRSFK